MINEFSILSPPPDIASGGWSACPSDVKWLAVTKIGWNWRFVHDVSLRKTAYRHWSSEPEDMGVQIHSHDITSVKMRGFPAQFGRLSFLVLPRS